MRKEYDFKKMRIKRRGVLPQLNRQAERQAKVRITITLDQDIVEYFKNAAEETGALPYQTQINQVLRKVVEAGRLDDLEMIKNQLLNDPEFILKLAKSIKAA